jgi:hypothetical protein
VTEKEMGMLEDHPSAIKCPKCGKRAYRYIGKPSVIIPEHFKSTSETSGDNATSLDHLKRRFAHSYPSNRDSKIYY